MHPLNQILWRQLGASIDMLKNAIDLCPESHWDTSTQFWYNAYHVLFFLDFHLTMEPVGFTPPAPFTLSELTWDELPDRVYTKQELLDYLQHIRDKCRTVIAGLTEESMHHRWIFEANNMNYPFLEILLYTMRHVQHHAAQLNLLLRQNINDAPRWVRHAKDDLS
jgi:hypothetical protein